MNQKGFAPILVILLVVILVAGGFVGWIYFKPHLAEKKANQTISSTDHLTTIPTATSTPASTTSPSSKTSLTSLSTETNPPCKKEDSYTWSDVTKALEQLNNVCALDYGCSSQKDFSEIAKFPNLKVITMSNVMCREDISPHPKALLAAAYKAKSLEILDIEFGDIDPISSQIGDLQNLKSLSLLGVNSIPKEIGNLSQLEILNLTDGSISRLPTEIGKLTKLKQLYLGAHFGADNGNNLTELPSEIKNLTNLEVLDISGNKINYLQSEIIDLPNLKILKIGSNPISSDEEKEIKERLPKVDVSFSNH